MCVVHKNSGKRSPLQRLALAAGLLAALALSTPAHATNKGTVSGVASHACSLVWNAKTVMDVDLKNDDPNYPNLMVDLNGNPVDYSNGGYISEVRPEYGGSGIMEITHFYIPGTPTTVVWRIPVATDFAVSNAQIVVTLPPYGAMTYSFDPASTNSKMSLWGTPYSNYTWAQTGATAVDNGDGTWTLNLGNMAAKSATVFQFQGTVPTGTDLTQPYIASAKMTGTYTKPGEPADCQPVKAVDDSYTVTYGGTTASVIVNDTANEAPAVIGTNVTLVPGTAPTPATGSLTMNPDGTITVAPGTTPGVYAYPYQICTIPATSPATCSSAVATVTVKVDAPATSVPTLSQWGLMLLGLLLGGTALRRRGG